MLNVIILDLIINDLYHIYQNNFINNIKITLRLLLGYCSD